MIQELRDRIDITINEALPLEENKWIIYGKCKQVLQDYEMQNKFWFSPPEWSKYIIYITNKLEI